MVDGKPMVLHYFLDWAMEWEVKGCFRPIKCPYFVSVSTTTSTISTPFDRGSPSTKSINISSQTQDGIGSGWKRPVGLTEHTLCC